MEWLVELRMDNNEICSVQGFTFNGMPRLRSVSLKNNKIMTFPEQAIQRLRGNIAVFDIDGNPLICGCNMLWLQVWLQELDQPGPHCIDGQLLRKTPLSRQDCSQQGRNVERAIPECNVELLASPGLYKTSQVSPLWMNLKSSENMTADLLGTKNYLAPTPEESDYFYDDYVDYPYNESLSDSNGIHTNKYKNKENGDTVTMKVPLSTKSPHFIPGESFYLLLREDRNGDTPTLYAGIKNKTRKPDIPPKVNNSPSSSGFTFFGVPLPSLNLNQLLGSGSGRLEGSSHPQLLRERLPLLMIQ
ncbi:hypothetical protein NQ318_011085 [Aromia moschata]|uniref:Uncharacterized protein n=1 Tax=Aromia moschata TaxID=1265417 RepID=A0AAV8YRN7_9CUCU|nr:hypothetical protein NQ318_011085 [Aromia moschata]